MIGNDACGSRSVRWGTTAQNVLGLDVITVAGERLHLVSPGDGEMAVAPTGPDGRTAPPVRRRPREPVANRADTLASTGLRISVDWLLPERGFDVARALVGTEGTCVVVAGATMRLWAPPAARCLLVLGIPG